MENNIHGAFCYMVMRKMHRAGKAAFTEDQFYRKKGETTRFCDRRKIW